MAPTCKSGISLALLLIFVMLTLIMALMPIGTHAFSFKLIPITSLFPNNLTLLEKHNKLVKISQHRQEQHSVIMITSISSSLVNSTNSTAKPNAVILRPSVRHRAPSGFYMVQVSIGSKLFSPYLVLDPGTDLTWVQCEGCTNCFPVRGSGNFKYQESQSYRKLPCNHTLCVPKLCTADGLYCRYDNRYLTSTSSGLLSTETFTFPTNMNQTTVKYPSLLFGCGLDNQNLHFSAPNNVIAGILGLSLSASSILIQLQVVTKRRFSYCLTTSDWPTLLLFGDDAGISQRQSGLQKTPLVPGLPRYYVSMSGISIDDKRLNINPYVFRLKRDFKGGFVVDAGTPYSHLVDSAYKVLRQEMIQYIAQRYTGLRPIQRGMGAFDLCYNLTMCHGVNLSL
ncbi:Aspartic peptidase [Trema orientale]|uniref:Aspartic peptidase n=1 Tax=Trema orientale TaxID=63057 RepID=A0A2P5D8B9_TREOI|nr:Aspartic peptidase [Trema orientale]